MDRSAVWAEPVHRCMLVLTCVLLLFEVIAGRLCNSLINMVDSFHTLYVLIGMTFSSRGAQENPGVSSQPQGVSYPDSGAGENLPSPLSDGAQYARFRVQPLRDLISALLLCSLCASISFDILSHMLQPHPIQRPLLAVTVGALSLLFNLLLLVWRRPRQTHAGGKEFRKGGTETPSNPTGSPHGGVLMFCKPKASSILNPDSQDHTIHPQSNSISHDPTHTETDESKCSCSSSGHAAGQQCEARECIRSIIAVFRSLLSSTLVLLNGVLYLLCMRFQWRCDVTLYLDPAFSMLTVLVLLVAVVPELFRYILVLLQASPSDLCTEELRVELRRVPGVLAVHELHVWQLFETCVVASVHVHWPSGLSTRECSQLLQRITDVLRRFGVKRWTVQPEFLTSHLKDAAFQPDCSLRCGKECVMKMCCFPPEECFSSTSVHNKDQDIIIQNTHL